jgi:hypothetical protein
VDALEAMQAKAEIPRARPQTVAGLLAVLLLELDGSDADERSAVLADWLARHLGLARAWNRDRANRRAELPRSARAFNFRAQRLSLELASRLGIETALCVARLVPLWRVDERTGDFHLSTLSGEVLSGEDCA